MILEAERVKNLLKIDLFRFTEGCHQYHSITLYLHSDDRFFMHVYRTLTVGDSIAFYWGKKLPGKPRVNEKSYKNISFEDFIKAVSKEDKVKIMFNLHLFQ